MAPLSSPPPPILTVEDAIMVALRVGEDRLLLLSRAVWAMPMYELKGCLACLPQFDSPVSACFFVVVGFGVRFTTWLSRQVKEAIIHSTGYMSHQQRRERGGGAST